MIDGRYGFAHCGGGFSSPLWAWCLFCQPISSPKSLAAADCGKRAIAERVIFHEETASDRVFDLVVYVLLALVSIVMIYPVFKCSAIAMSDYSGYLENPMMIFPRTSPWTAR